MLEREGGLVGFDWLGLGGIFEKGRKKERRRKNGKRGGGGGGMGGCNEPDLVECVFVLFEHGLVFLREELELFRR